MRRAILAAAVLAGCVDHPPGIGSFNVWIIFPRSSADLTLR